MRIKYLFAPLCSLFIVGSSFAQIPGAAIDVQHYTFAIKLDDANNEIVGNATIDVKFLKDAKDLQFDLVKRKENGKGMLVSAVKENGKSLAFKQDDEAVIINAPAKAGSVHHYVIDYSGVPADGLII